MVTNCHQLFVIISYFNFVFVLVDNNESLFFSQCITCFILTTLCRHKLTKNVNTNSWCIFKITPRLNYHNYMYLQIRLDFKGQITLTLNLSIVNNFKLMTIQKFPKNQSPVKKIKKYLGKIKHPHTLTQVGYIHILYQIYGFNG